MLQSMGSQSQTQFSNWTTTEGKESACNVRDPGSILGSGRTPEGGHGNLLQCSCLENPMDRGAWRVTVHVVTKSWTQLSNSFTSPGLRTDRLLNLLYETFNTWLGIFVFCLRRRVELNMNLYWSSLQNLLWGQMVLKKLWIYRMIVLNQQTFMEHLLCFRHYLQPMWTSEKLWFQKHNMDQRKRNN